MSENQTHFGFTKLVVHDLEGAASFYKEVCGLTELARVDEGVNGRRIQEIMFNPTGQGAATFVLFKFLDRTTPSSEEVILGFQTPDISAFIQRVKAAGGEVVQNTVTMPHHGIKVAFVKDTEGHLIEVVEFLQAG